MSKKRTSFVDAHCHLFDKNYINDFSVDKMIERAIKNNIEFLIVNGGHEKENKKIIDLSKKYPIVKALIGIHPEDGKDKDDYKKIENLIDENVCGIGELGLDYYYEDAPSREKQIESLEGQIKLAHSKKLPVVLHVRDKEGSDLAFEDTYKIVSKFNGLKFMLHTYAGNIEWAKKFMKFNCYFSFSGVVTFGSNDQAREVVKFLPVERILVETDSPYLRSHPYVNLVNEPSTVLFVAYYVAGLKGIGMDKFNTIINRNLRELFNLK
ncbi:TatD family hydrolase [Mycoplasma crocodyli]|uniref:Putative deoxyribonuclease n=1 Tax=Mycoplasma crocodyli (strain ATCC 51981 / MP145) TaxID=512564 RepID=D5E4J9_MYCCM|nr:TatD family hydrolase [Mycoplasma crocodyli]ADE19774.1 putative deoxyribonuclease [Mycoplasma crocodyli MP145]